MLEIFFAIEIRAGFKLDSLRIQLEVISLSLWLQFKRPLSWFYCEYSLFSWFSEKFEVTKHLVATDDFTATKILLASKNSLEGKTKIMNTLD